MVEMVDSDVGEFSSKDYAKDRKRIVIERLEDQITWYDKKSQSSQKWYKWLKGVVIISSATIPALVVSEAQTWISAALGVLITACEGLQHLNQYNHNWITYRSTCEALKHEKFMFLAQSGPYADVEDRHSTLAERIESLISTEHSKWIAGQRAAETEHRPQ